MIGLRHYFRLMMVAQTLALHSRDLGILPRQAVIFPLPTGLNTKESRVVAIRPGFKLTVSQDWTEILRAHIFGPGNMG